MIISRVEPSIVDNTIIPLPVIWHAAVSLSMPKIGIDEMVVKFLIILKSFVTFLVSVGSTVYLLC